MNRRTMIGGMMAAAAAAPAVLRADELSDWAAWWERSKRYTLQIAEAMPAGDYNFAPFGNGTPDAVRSGDGARTFAQVMQHIAQGEGFYLGRLGKGGPAPAAPQNDTSKATTVKYLNAHFDWAIGVVKQLTQADLTKSFAGRRRSSGERTRPAAQRDGAHGPHAWLQRHVSAQQGRQAAHVPSLTRRAAPEQHVALGQ